jgi:hypothetical protein
MTMLQAGLSGARIPAEERLFSLGPPHLFNGYRGYLSGIIRPERDVDHSPSYSAEVKNEESYTSTSIVCLHGVGWEK